MPNDPSSQHYLILLVEDDTVTGMTLEDELIDAGFEVSWFASCANALNWLQQHRPDGAILDVSLVGETCQEVAHELQARNIPFLIYSGRRKSEGLLPEFQHIEWLEKPCRLETVIGTLRGLISAQSRVGA